MIPPEIYNYDQEQLAHWITHEAGSSNKDYFHATKSGGFKLQQVGAEYSKLLLFLKAQNIKSYLGLGIGNGGSFALECFFMQGTLKTAIAVDSLEYGDKIGQNEAEVKDFLSMPLETNKDLDVLFYKNTTDYFFDIDPDKYDAIFVDADHDYLPAKRDYLNSLNHINKGGFIIFHDINSEACPGIRQLWSEVKRGYTNWEFVASKTCGIGIIQIN